MQYSEPDIRIERVPNNLEQYIRELAETETFEYALIAHSGDSSFHNDLKLFERDTEMIIQGIQIKTVKKVLEKNQKLTIENLVHKANVKTGGMNYAIITPAEPALRDLFGPDTLFLGIATNHPGGGFYMGNKLKNLDLFPDNGDSPGKGPNGDQLKQPPGPNGAQRRGGPNGNRAGKHGVVAQPMLEANHNRPNTPSVVGFAAKIGMKHPNELVGDFHYQPPLREEKVSIIADICQVLCPAISQETSTKVPAEHCHLQKWLFRGHV